MSYKENNHLFEIIKKLSDNHINYIICGGVALVLHGIERLTIDIDLSIDMSEENLKKFLKVMNKLKLVPRVPVKADILLDPEQREMMIRDKNALVFTFIDVDHPYRQVDVFLTERMSYDNLLAKSEKMIISDISVNVVTKEELLEMKKEVEPPMDKDVYDIQILKKKLKEEYSVQE